MTTGPEITRIAAFDDNYIWLLRDPDSGAVAVVDPGDAGPVLAELDRRGLTLTHILLTHHHDDHIGGVAALKARFPAARIIGHAADAHRLPPLDQAVSDGDAVSVGGWNAVVIAVPGHTLGHIAYWFAAAAALFCGDTLFALGCGRMFEGTPAQMWASLARLRALPVVAPNGADVMVYCAHEYTAGNARFALTLDPGNPALTAQAAAIAAARAQNLPTVPSRLADEIAANPFLRADVPALQAAVGLAGADPAAVFGEIRHRKDVFRG